MGEEKVKVEIREFNEENRDIEMVEKLERSCEIGSKIKGASIFTNMMGDPLCRITFFPLHIMLVSSYIYIVFFKQKIPEVSL